MPSLLPGHRCFSRYNTRRHRSLIPHSLFSCGTWGRFPIGLAHESVPEGPSLPNISQCTGIEPGFSNPLTPGLVLSHSGEISCRSSASFPFPIPHPIKQVVILTCCGRTGYLVTKLISSSQIPSWTPAPAPLPSSWWSMNRGSLSLFWAEDVEKPTGVPSTSLFPIAMAS